MVVPELAQKETHGKEMTRIQDDSLMKATPFKNCHLRKRSIYEEETSENKSENHD